MLLTPAQVKPNPFESRRNSFFCTVGDASHVYVRALALGCFHSNISATLRASLSGTFLQTLPDLVTSLLVTLVLSPRSCPPTRSAPSETGSGTEDYGSNLAPKHARKHEAHPPRVKKRVPSRFKRLWFYLSWRKQHGQL